jgi:quercetin dioxygenase-like cupin family protein
VNDVEEIQVIRKRDAKNFMEGDEDCRLYVKTEKIVFGTSRLFPGKRGAVDPGHRQGQEIFYVAKGRVICHFPNKGTCEELEEGDVVLIPPGEPHELLNHGDEEALVSWSLAPPD